MAILINSNSKWAFSAKGNPIALVSSGQNYTQSTRPILIIGGVHGDEPEGVWLSEHLIDWLSITPTQIPWLVVPCINPDGYSENKRTNGNGVDLNRNFPCPNWTTDHKQERYYPGPFAGSEPESQALIKLISEQKPQLIIHCHSWEPCIVYTGEPGKQDADKLAKSSGYLARPDIGYPTPGSLGEYGWKMCGIPVICIEEQEGEKKENIWPHFKAGFEAIFADLRLRI